MFRWKWNWEAWKGSEVEEVSTAVEEWMKEKMEKKEKCRGREELRDFKKRKSQKIEAKARESQVEKTKQLQNRVREICPKMNKELQSCV